MRYTSLALFLFFAGAAGAQEATSVNGTWTAEIRSARVFLQLRTRQPDATNADGPRGDWSSGQTVDIDDFMGLPAGDDGFSASSLKFELRREAGTLAFDGAFRDGRGAGLYTFVPRPEFAAEMKALGYNDSLSTWRRYQLAAYDVGPRYIRALKSEGYDNLTLDEIQRGRNHGVSLDYIRGMKAEGYRFTDWDQAIRMRDHGVTQQFVQTLRGAGYSSLPLDQLIRAKDHGVNASLLEGLSKEGFKNLALEDVIRIKDHGVSAEYIEDMKALGFKDLTADQLVRLRDHGITPGFVNHARARGLKDGTIDDLIRFKNTGRLR